MMHCKMCGVEISDTFYTAGWRNNPLGMHLPTCSKKECIQAYLKWLGGKRQKRCQSLHKSRERRANSMKAKKM